jgi:outer membrane protein assembly factor BamB
MTDSRGHLYSLDGNGRPKFEVTATRYRAGVPSIGDVNGDGKPEIVFGTDDGDVYALDRRGGVLWSAKLDGRFGRSLPLVADAGHDGKYEVYMPTSFNARGEGLFALDAASGKLLWKAKSVMQSYRSTVVADLDGDGSDEILFADKNTRLYCLDAKGVERWSTQMDGLGMFFAPAVADLEGNGQARIFAIVRGAGTNGHSLYVLDPAGRIVHSLPLPGGGAGSPILGRFEGRKDVTLLVLSGSGQLLCYRLPQKPEAARILWPGLRNDVLNSGFVRSRAKVVPQPVPAAARLPVSVPRAEERPTQPVAAVRQIVNPWPNTGTVAPPGSLTASMLGNEYESAAIAVTNPEDRPLTLQLDCGPFRSETKVEVEASKVIEFREVLEVLLNTTGKPSEDALPRLGEARTIRLGPRETRKIWLTLRSHDLAAGRHTATLRVGDPLSLAPPLEVPVHLTVHPVRLPARFTYRHCNWLNFSALRDEVQREAVIRDALDHGTNVFVIPPVTFPVDANGELGAADGGLHDVLVRRLRGKAVFLVLGSAGLRWPAGAKPDAVTERRVWAEAVRRYALHMQGLGCGYDDWAFYLKDEPGLGGPDAYYDAYVELVRKVKAADPRARIYANPAGGARADVLQPIKDLIDIWSPDLHLVREQPEKLGQIFRRAKDYWHYEAPADQRNLDPLGFYRVKPWVAFQLGMNGGGYWVYHYQNLWLADPAVAAEYGVVYLTGKGPVTTKRWEASRDGIEDYELLSMLRESARRSKSGAAKEALALIDEAVAFVTRGQDRVSDISRQLHRYTPDYRKWMEYRDRLIQMQVRLSQEK